MSTRAPVAVALLLAAFTRTLTAQAPPAAGAEAARDVSSATLCGTAGFATPVPSIERLQAAMARPAMQRDVAAVLAAAGLEALEAQTNQILANSLVTDVSLPAASRIEWLARSAPRPAIAGPVRWAGPGPLEGFGFVIDDLSSTYTFIVPKRCATIALVKREPSLEAARRAEAASAAEAARQREQEVQARLQAAERERAALKARRDEEVRRATERAAVETKEVEEETARALAAQRERERQLVAQALAAERAAAPTAAVDEPRGLGVFLTPFAGATRQRVAGNAGWSAVAGAKAGLDVGLGRRWGLRPSIGVDTLVNDSGYTRLSLETEVRVALGPRFSVGSGIAVADAARGDRARVAWLGTFATPIGSPGRRLPARVLLEGQRLFDRAGAPDEDYRVVVGLELRMR
jgi:hypothetical protein